MSAPKEFATSTDMTIGAYDLEVFRAQREDAAIEQRAAEAERKHARSINRWQNGAIGAGLLALASAVIGVTFMIWQGVAGPSAKQELLDKQQSQCVAERGNWLPIATGDSSKTHTCIFGEVRNP